MTTLTRSLRCGDNHASYYIHERAEIVTRDGALALVCYTGRICDGLYSVDGHFMGGDPAEWTRVTEVTPAVQAVIDVWVRGFGGWEVAGA